MIEFQGLAKWYGSCEAVKPLSLTVPRGAVFSFLGPNGAGKTSTIRMMMGILVPSAGRVLVDGLDCHADAARVKRRVGYVPDTPVFHDSLRGHEILARVAGMHGLSRDDAHARTRSLIAAFGLHEVASDVAVNYAPGLKKKLALACALVHEPSVLILDEPFSGLDGLGPGAVDDVCERLLAEAARGATVFLSTRLLDVAERISDQIGIIDEGNLVAAGTPDQIRSVRTRSAHLLDVFQRMAQTSMTRSGRNAACSPLLA